MLEALRTVYKLALSKLANRVSGEQWWRRLGVLGPEAAVAGLAAQA